jgi:hypothetical protein
MAKVRVIIYLRDTDNGKLDDAEKKCGEYSERFGWQVLDTLRNSGSGPNLSELVLKINRLKAQIIVTDSLDMISADQEVRDNFMEAIERNQCIVHPISMPLRRP